MTIQHTGTMSEVEARAQGAAIKHVMEREKIPFEQAVNKLINIGVFELAKASLVEWPFE